MSKILPESAATSLREKYAPEQIVFTNGCFDILHVGHVRYLAAVDHVIIFNEPRVTALVKELRPHIYAKGGDYTIDSLNPEELAAIREVGAQIKLLPLVPGKSTTALLRAIQEK